MFEQQPRLTTFQSLSSSQSGMKSPTIKCPTNTQANAVQLERLDGISSLGAQRPGHCPEETESARVPVFLAGLIYRATKLRNAAGDSAASRVEQHA